MDYISEMKKLKISFQSINEQNALAIMQNEYSYFQLMEYANLFDKYHSTDKKGTFVHLDFAQIYHLASIDEKLRHLIICQCLELEKFLKLRLANIFNEDQTVSLRLYQEYIKLDAEYIAENYSEPKLDILHTKYPDTKISQLSPEQFLDIIQFGTLERFYVFFSEYYMHLSSEKNAMLKECFASTRLLRNAAAHNNAILSNLRMETTTGQLLYSTKMIQNYLSNSGIHQKTLSTNMSKKIVCDLCNFLFLCREIFPTTTMKEYCKKWTAFLDEISENDAEFLSSNEILKSVYTFTKNMNMIFSRDEKYFI